MAVLRLLSEDVDAGDVAPQAIRPSVRIFASWGRQSDRWSGSVGNECCEAGLNEVVVIFLRYCFVDE